ncbi:MAG: alpha/beta fold hydrolase [Spirochaetes bacterium]|nr:alpha/beta fold hydrolase [Spirochaetota bacterium]
MPSDTKVLPTAAARRMPGRGDAVLVIHGFTGWPGELAFLGDRLAERGLAVSIPRLPGHGTNSRDFMETGWRDWLRAATDAYLELASVHRRVHVVGFSMGGLLAIILAARLPVGRVALVAPAVRVNNPLLPFVPLLALFAPRMRWPYVRPHGSVSPEDEEVLAREYWSWRFGGQSASFLRLQRMANRVLSRVTADTLVVLGGKDPTVPLSSWDFIRARIGSTVLERVEFPESVHQILSGDDRAPAADAIVRWLTAPAPTGTVRA